MDIFTLSEFPLLAAGNATDYPGEWDDKQVMAASPIRFTPATGTFAGKDTLFLLYRAADDLLSGAGRVQIGVMTADPATFDGSNWDRQRGINPVIPDNAVGSAPVNGGDYNDMTVVEWNGRLRLFVNIYANPAPSNRMVLFESLDGLTWTYVQEITHGGTYFGRTVGPLFNSQGNLWMLVSQSNGNGGSQRALRGSTDGGITWSDYGLAIPTRTDPGTIGSHSFIVGRGFEDDLYLYALMPGMHYIGEDEGGDPYADWPSGILLYRLSKARLGRTDEIWERYPHPVKLREPTEGGCWQLDMFPVGGSWFGTYQQWGMVGWENIGTDAMLAARDTPYYGLGLGITTKHIMWAEAGSLLALEYWDREPIPNGTYLIRHLESGLYLTLDAGAVILDKVPGHTATWAFDIRMDFRRMSNVSSGPNGVAVLRVPDRKEGSALGVAAYDAGPYVGDPPNYNTAFRQQWLVRAVKTPEPGAPVLCAITNRHSSLSLAVRNDADAPGAIVEQRPFIGQSEMLWEVVPVIPAGTEVTVPGGPDPELPTPLPGGDLVGTTATQTLTNKTMASLLMTGAPRAIGLTADGRAQFMADLKFGPRFLSRTEAMGAATGRTGDALIISVLHGGQNCDYIYDPDGIALTTGDGRKWMPLGRSCVQHFGAQGHPNDDTVAFQAAINACDASGAAQGVGGRRLYVPPGRYLCGLLNITRPIDIEGDGSQHCEIIGTTGMALAQFAVRVAHDGTDYPQVGLTPAKVTVAGLRLVGPGKTDPGGASGFDFGNAPSNSAYTTVILRGVEILNYPAAALRGASWNGYGRAYDCNFHNNGGNNLDFNSCFDWRFIGGEISTATGFNVLLSGCGQFTFLGVYNYGAGEYNFGTYRSGFKIIGGALDSSQKGGLLWGDGTGGLAGHCIGVSFFNNSRAGAGLYPDIFVGATANSELRLDNCDFIDPDTINTNYNVFFEGTTQVVYHSDCQFKSGSFTDPQVTNQPTLFVSQSGHFRSEAATARSLKPLRIEANAQYSGLSVVNGDGVEIATLVGWDDENLNGVLTLFQGDGTVGQRFAAPGSGVASLLTLPGPYDDDAAAISVGGLTTGRAYRQTGAGLAYVGGGATGGVINANYAYPDRPTAQAAIISPAQNILRLYHEGILLEYRRDPGGTAIQTAGGQNWSPAGGVSVLHWGLVSGSRGAADQNTDRINQAAAFCRATGRDLHLWSGTAFFRPDAMDLSGIRVRGAGITTWRSAAAYFAGFASIDPAPTQAVLTGTTRNPIRVHGASSMRACGALRTVAVPRAEMAESEWTLLSFMNADATTGAATPRDLAVGFILNNASSHLSDFRVVPDAGGLHGLDGYANAAAAEIFGSVDIGILQVGGGYCEINRVQAVGHFRMAGRVVLLQSLDGQYATFLGPTGTRDENCQYEGVRGLMIRGPDRFRIIASTATSVDLPWAADHPFTLDAGHAFIRLVSASTDTGGGDHYAYTGVEKVTVGPEDRIRLTGLVDFDPTGFGAVAPAGIGTGSGASTAGSSHTVFRDVQIGALTIPAGWAANDAAVTGRIENGAIGGFEASGWRLSEVDIQGRIQHYGTIAGFAHDVRELTLDVLTEVNSPRRHAGAMTWIVSPQENASDYGDYPTAGARFVTWRYTATAQLTATVPDVAPFIPHLARPSFFVDQGAGWFEAYRGDRVASHQTHTYGPGSTVRKLPAEKIAVGPGAEGSSGFDPEADLHVRRADGAEVKAEATSENAAAAYLMECHGIAARMRLDDATNALVIEIDPGKTGTFYTVFSAGIEAFITSISVSGTGGSAAIRHGRKAEITIPAAAVATIQLSGADFTVQGRVTSNNTAGGSGEFWGRAGSSPFAGFSDATNFSAVTTDVTGTTGTYTNATLSIQNGLLKLENNTGATRTYEISFY